jgi:TonB family protein
MRSPAVRAATFFLLILLFVGLAPAAQNTALLNPDQRIEAWKASLHDIDVQLRKGEFAPARQSAIELTQDMVQQMGAGGSSAYTLAVACTFRAIAEAGLGKEEDALWYWRTAAAIFPGIEKTDLRPYGAPAARLKETPFRAQIGTDLRGAVKTVQRPVLKKHADPEYPKNMQKMGVQTQYVFEVIIDPRGRLSEPKVLTPIKEPSLVYVVLETIKGWEFEPATSDGKPVAILYTLTVSFHARR